MYYVNLENQLGKNALDHKSEEPVSNQKSKQFETGELTEP